MPLETLFYRQKQNSRGMFSTLMNNPQIVRNSNIKTYYQGHANGFRTCIRHDNKQFNSTRYVFQGPGLMNPMFIMRLQMILLL